MSKDEYNFSGVSEYMILPNHEELKELSKCKMFEVTMRVWRTSKSKAGKRKVLVRTRIIYE